MRGKPDGLRAPNLVFGSFFQGTLNDSFPGACYFHSIRAGGSQGLAVRGFIFYYFVSPAMCPLPGTPLPFVDSPPPPPSLETNPLQLNPYLALHLVLSTLTHKNEINTKILFVFTTLVIKVSYCLWLILIQMLFLFGCSSSCYGLFRS